MNLISAQEPKRVELEATDNVVIISGSKTGVFFLLCNLYDFSYYADGEKHLHFHDIDLMRWPCDLRYSLNEVVLYSVSEADSSIYRLDKNELRVEIDNNRHLKIEAFHNAYLQLWEKIIRSLLEDNKTKEISLLRDVPEIRIKGNVNNIKIIALEDQEIPLIELEDIFAEVSNGSIVDFMKKYYENDK